MKFVRAVLLLLTCALAVALGQAAPPQESKPQESPKPAEAPPAKPEKPLTPAEAMRKSIEKQRAAVAKQRETARKQAESAGATLRPGDIPPVFGNARVLADCDPLAADILNPLIESNAKSQAVKPELL